MPLVEEGTEETNEMRRTKKVRRRETDRAILKRKLRSECRVSVVSLVFWSGCCGDLFHGVVNSRLHAMDVLHLFVKAC